MGKNERLQSTPAHEQDAFQHQLVCGDALGASLCQAAT